MSARDSIPPEQWVMHPPNDWADYADKMPVYEADLDAAASVEFAQSQPKPKPARKRRSRKRKRPGAGS